MNAERDNLLFAKDFFLHIVATPVYECVGVVCLVKDIKTLRKLKNEKITFIL